MEKLTFQSVRAGETLPSISHTVNQETFWKYAVASFDYNPVHCDPNWVATARPFGIPETVAHGMMTWSFMVSVATSWAYASMLKITKLSAKFVKPVAKGTTVTCSGIISEKHVISPGKSYVVLDLKAENQNGEALGVGQAVVVFPD
jgi:3-hydroxybutyryl-CoA dehydratase